MLLTLQSPEELDIPRLLAIYREDSLENGQEMYPEEPSPEAALARYEADYAAFMRTEFFTAPGCLWMVGTGEGRWVSALRLLPLEEPNTWMIEALETHPEHRRRGHAARLLADTIRLLEDAHGAVTLLSCVAQRNTPSLRAHLRAGFVWEGETRVEDSIVTGRRYTMAYRSPQGVRSTATGASSSKLSGVTRQS